MLSPASICALVVALIVGVVIGTATLASASQSPANCDENDFILQVKQNPGPVFTVGQTINYTVRTGNTDPANEGCDIDGTSVSLTTPDGVVHPLQSGGAYPFPTAVTQVGATIPYVVNLADAVAGPCGNVALCPVIVATANANGMLHDDPVQDDPWSVQKQLSGPVSAPEQLHYMCYETQRQPIAPGKVNVTDQFGSSAPVLSQLHKLCNPANKNDEDPSAVNNPNHLDGYPASVTTTPAAGHKVSVTNQFGTITLTIQQALTVMVPSAKSLTGPIGPLATPGDPFICYHVKYTGFTTISGVKVQDEFTTQILNLNAINELCDPASVNNAGQGAAADSTHLVCYNAQNQSFKSPAVWVNDMFQARKVNVDLHVWELCVPSTKKVLS
jgi:hypothetical protein